jgi:hypothetical protein
MNELTVGREPLVIVEIQQKACSRRFGVPPCLGTGNPCYNSFATCRYYQAFNWDDTVIWRFVKPEAKIMGDYIPSLAGYTTTSAKINIGGGSNTESPLGRRATVTITLTDHPSDDRYDLYLNQRDGNPLEKGTFWGKWLARNPYYQSFKVILYEGHYGQELSDMQQRLYFLDKIILDSKGKVTITCKDPLNLGDNKRGLCPEPKEMRLAVDISPTQTTGIIIEAGDNDITTIHGNSSLKYLRIDDEIIGYTGAAISQTLFTLTGVVRGSLGTEADEHDVDEATYRIIRYENMSCWRVAYDLLTKYTSLSAEFIDLNEWDAEGNIWLNIFVISGTIEASISANELLGEICEQCLFYIWWDERTSKVKLKAIRPELAEVVSINDYSNIIKDSLIIKENPEQRTSRVIIYFNRKNSTEDLKRVGNYKNATLRIDGDSEFAYQESKVKQLWSRWLTTDAQAHQLSVRFLERYKLNPKYITLKLDAKDRGINIGDVVIVDTASVQDEFGDNIVTMWQVISLNEIQQGETLQIEMQSFEFMEGERYGLYTYDDALNYGDYTRDERLGKAFYCDDNNLVAGDDPYLYS